jgi:outer membrane protein TolC
VAYSKARYTELLTTYHKTVITAFSNVESAWWRRGKPRNSKAASRCGRQGARAYEFAQRRCRPAL